MAAEPGRGGLPKAAAGPGRRSRAHVQPRPRPGPYSRGSNVRPGGAAPASLTLTRPGSLPRTALVSVSFIPPTWQQVPPTRAREVGP
jgi:hypothetical protein